MTGQRLLSFANGNCLPQDSVPLLEVDKLQARILTAVEQELRVVSLFATPPRDGGPTRLTVLLADDQRGSLQVGACEVTGGAFPALTPRCPQVHLFEREIHEQSGLLPEGHPWLKPVRFAPPLVAPAAGNAAAPSIGIADFYRIDGEEVHEVAVGPVHAGVIEPGHFRFQCHGEEVFH
ncbi:MAG TPA: hydrogenase, partial [Planctomycetota bacterium]|nr:hydrogenase [Planctomycetota bacterium]